MLLLEVVADASVGGGALIEAVIAALADSMFRLMISTRAESLMVPSFLLATATCWVIESIKACLCAAVILGWNIEVVTRLFTKAAGSQVFDVVVLVVVEVDVLVAVPEVEEVAVV